MNPIKQFGLSSLLSAVMLFPPAGIEGIVELSGNEINYELEGNTGQYSLPDSVSLISGAWQDVEGPYETALLASGNMAQEDAGKLDLLLCSETGQVFVLPWRLGKVEEPVQYGDYITFMRGIFNDYTR